MKTHTKVPLLKNLLKVSEVCFKLITETLSDVIYERSQRLSPSREIVLKLCFCLKVFCRRRRRWREKRIQSLTPFDNCLMKRGKKRQGLEAISNPKKDI